MKPLRHPDQLAALQRQIANEKAATEARQRRHEAHLASMPEDLRVLYQVGLGLEEVRQLLRRGMFPNDTHEHVADLREFMRRHVIEQDLLIQEHPRFAEFFPEAAARRDAAEVQRVAVESAPVLLGPDGEPLDLAPVVALEPEIVQ